MSRKYSGKFYNKREKEIMQRYGLDSTPQSGAGWLIKEDGQNDNVICQLKSTSANSYRLSLDDIDKLEYHASVEHKIPLFIVDFIERDEQYLIINSKDFKRYCNVSEWVSDKPLPYFNNFIQGEVKQTNKRIIKSSVKGKEKLENSFQKQREEKERKYQERIKKIKEQRRSK